jgi:hypothetical protein
MDADRSLAELLRHSTQVVEAVVSGPSGIEAATVADPDRARALSTAGAELLAATAGIRPGEAVAHVAVSLADGTVVVVPEGVRTLTATTVPDPAASLVVHDLRRALQRLDGASVATGSASR